MQEAVQRISSAMNGGSISPDLYAASTRRSFILSIDQAHAIHPNYSSKHETAHAPKLNAGVVIKRNSNQRYATNSVTGFLLKELGRLAEIPMQEFVVRNDCPCGSTIGPAISARTGIRTVDAGMPQLSMHSCREVMGIADCEYLIRCRPFAYYCDAVIPTLLFAFSDLWIPAVPNVFSGFSQGRRLSQQSSRWLG